MGPKKKVILLRPSKHAVAAQRPHGLTTPSGALTVTNTLGAHVQDRVRAALARAGRGAPTKNAIGGAVAASPAGGGNVNATAGVATNAIGMTVHIHPGLAGPNSSENRTVSGAPTATAPNRFVINGRDMIRPGSGGGIGGPARNAVGGISGNSFHLRQPP